MADALIGKNGWLYLCNDSNGSLEQYQGVRTFTQDDLEHYRKVLEKRHALFAASGIPYMFVVAPNKQTIYPEFLPDNLKKAPQGTPYERLLAYMRQRSDFEILDLRKDLMEKKKLCGIYHKHDTHWNHEGAYYAYCAIMQKMQAYLPHIRIRSLNDFRLKAQDWKTPDLYEKTKMRFFEGHFQPHPGPYDIDSEDNDIFLSPKGKRSLKSPGDPHLNVSKTRPSFVFRNEDATLPRMLLFRDSFGTRIMHYLAESFQRLASVWKPNPVFELTQVEKPDIVLQIMVERFLIAAPEDPSNLF
jgi:hypothetical protein